MQVGLHYPMAERRSFTTRSSTMTGARGFGLLMSLNMHIEGPVGFEACLAADLAVIRLTAPPLSTCLVNRHAT